MLFLSKTQSVLNINKNVLGSIKIFLAAIFFTQTVWGAELLFQENKGQFNDKVLFKAPLNYGAVFIEKNKLTFVLHNKTQLDELKNHIHGDHNQKKHQNLRVHFSNQQDKSQHKEKHHHDGIHQGNEHQGDQHKGDGHEEDLGNKNRGEEDGRHTNDPHKKFKFSSHSFSISFNGANKHAKTIGSNPSAHYYNYFKGNDRKKWASKVKAYQDLWIKELYHGIDFHIYGSQNKIKYEFIVSPDASYEQIKLLYSGVNKLNLAHNKILIRTSVGTIKDENPLSFIKDKKKEGLINTSYILDHHTVSFVVDDYDKKDTLVLDPLLNFATFSGSVVDNWGFTATYDNNGNAFGGGVSFGTGYPVTTGAYQSIFGGGSIFDGGPDGLFAAYPTDIVISKFSADGNELLYATYLGGSKLENPHSLVVSPNNELIIFGTTSSRDFPTSLGAFDNTFNGGTSVVVDDVLYFEGSDIVITKISADGSSLLGSTYFGGSNNDGFNDENHTTGLFHNYSDVFRGEVITDQMGNAYIATTTSSLNLPIHNGFQTAYGGGSHDGLVAKFNDDLSELLWSSYLGGSDADGIYALQANSSNDLYITGGTKSLNFPASASAYQTSLSGDVDGFVAQISTSGSTLKSASFIGSSSYDQGYFVQIDNENKVFVMGQTLGNLPVSPGVYNNPNSGSFVHKYNENLSVLEASTVIGNSSDSTDLIPSAFLVDNCNKVYISGWSGLINRAYSGGTSIGMPVTSDAFQSGTDGSDFYLMVLEQDFQGLNYATFFGSPGAMEHVDGGTSRFNKTGTVYQAVCAACGAEQTAFPVTPGAYSTSMNSPNCNMAVFKFDASKLTAKINPISDTLVCQNDTIRFYNASNGGTSVEWQFHDGTSSNQLNPRKIFNVPGTYQVMLIVKDPSTCPNADTSTMNFTVKPIAKPSVASADSVICESTSTVVVMNQNQQYVWFDETENPIPFLQTFTYSPSKSTTLFVTTGQICSDTLPIPITVTPAPRGDSMQLLICPGDTAIFPLQKHDDYTYSWDPMLHSMMKHDSLYFYPDNSTEYQLIIDGSCGSVNVIYEVNVTSLNPQLIGDSTICFGDSIRLTASGADSYTWSPAINGITNLGNNPIFVGDDTTVFTVVYQKNDCELSRQIMINVNPPGPIPEFNSDSLCEDQTASFLIQQQADYTYSWNTLQGLSFSKDSVLISPTQSTLYELTITGLCGTKMIPYDIHLTSFNTMSSPDTIVCLNESIPLSVSGGTKAFWEPSVNGNDSSFQQQFIGDSTTRFIVQLSKDNCLKEESILVEVLPARPQSNYYSVSLCENERAALPFAVQSDFEYSWVPNDGFTVQGNSVTFDTNESVNHLLNIAGDCGSAQVEYDIKVIVINDSVAFEPMACQEDTVILQAFGGDQYQWSPSTNLNDPRSSNPSLIVDQSTSYFVSIIKNGCSKTRELKIDAIPIKRQNIQREYTINFGENQPLKLDPQFEYQFNPTTYLNCQSCISAYSEAEQDITYHFTYLDENKCLVSDSVKINVIYELYIPNAFSPDGNGINDEFKASSAGIKEFHMDIFNRWGEKIFSSDDISKSWDGTYQGEKVQIDVYVWTISYTKTHSTATNKKVGTLTLIR